MPKPRARTRPLIAPARLAEFLELLEATASVTEAAEQSGLRRSSLYKRRRSDEAFAARWDEALDTGLDRLQDRAVGHALDGTPREVWYRGEQVGTARVHDNRMMQFLLKAHRPQIYDRANAGAAAMPFDFAKRMAAAEKRMAAYRKKEKMEKKDE